MSTKKQQPSYEELIVTPTEETTVEPVEQAEEVTEKKQTIKKATKTETKEKPASAKTKVSPNIIMNQHIQKNVVSTLRRGYATATTLEEKQRIAQELKQLGVDLVAEGAEVKEHLSEIYSRFNS